MFTSDSIWGIDIGDSCIKAVQLERKDGQLFVLDFEYIEVDPERKAKEGERVVVRAALENLLARISMDRRNEVSISVPARHVNSRYISLPSELKPKAMELALTEEAKKQIPFPLEEVEWGVHRLPDRDDQAQYALFAVKKENIEEILEVVDAERVRVRGIQVPGLALYNYITRMVEVQEHTVILDFGERSTDLIVIHDGACWLRSMPLSGHHITELLEKKFRITTKEAGTLKHEMERSPQRDKLFRVIEPKLKELVTEIKRSLNFRRTQVKTLKATRFAAYGGSSRLAGVADYFIQNLGLEPFTLDPAKSLDFSRLDNAQRLRDNLASFGVAFGLAVQGLGEGEVELNLMPQRRITRQLLREKRVTGGIMVGCVIAMVLMQYIAGCRVSDKLVDGLKRAKAKESALSKVSSDFTRESGALKPIESDTEFKIKMLRGNDFASRIYEAVLTTLESCPGVLLTELTLKPIPPQELLGEGTGGAEGAPPPPAQPFFQNQGGGGGGVSAADFEFKVQGAESFPVAIQLAYVAEKPELNQVFAEKLVAHEFFEQGFPIVNDVTKSWKYVFELPIRETAMGKHEELSALRKEKGWEFTQKQESSRSYKVNSQTLTLQVNMAAVRGEKSPAEPGKQP